MPWWAFILTCGWMLAIPFFTKESLASIYQQSPDVDAVPAKCTALFVGVLWPIFFGIGLWRMLTKKKQ